jgi:hypothetical protein
MAQPGDNGNRAREAAHGHAALAIYGTDWTNGTFHTKRNEEQRDPLMATAQVRRTNPPPGTKITSPAVAEMIGVFAKRNPQCSRAQLQTIGKLVAEVGAAAAKLPAGAQRRLAARSAELRQVITEIATRPSASVSTEQSLKLVARGPVEVSQGEGQGAVLTTEEGRERLAAYATATKIEAWAGRLAGPTELERDFGTARSTLHAWQKQGDVIGLLVGVRKHAFPVEQFVDGRPVAGLGLVLQVIGEPRTTWLWLREPNPELAGATPLARLKAGAINDVLEIARLNFART